MNDDANTIDLVYKYSRFHKKTPAISISNGSLLTLTLISIVIFILFADNYNIYAFNLCRVTALFYKMVDKEQLLNPKP